jgi:hypothetical protein
MDSTTRMITAVGADCAGDIPASVWLVGGPTVRGEIGGLRPLTPALDPPGPMSDSLQCW